MQFIYFNRPTNFNLCRRDAPIRTYSLCIQKTNPGLIDLIHIHTFPYKLISLDPNPYLSRRLVTSGSHLAGIPTQHYSSYKKKDARKKPTGKSAWHNNSNFNKKYNPRNSQLDKKQQLDPTSSLTPPPTRVARSTPPLSPNPQRGCLNRLKKLTQRSKLDHHPFLEPRPPSFYRKKSFDAPDTEEYLSLQTQVSKWITLFGRKPVLDALRDPSIQFHHIHIDERLLGGKHCQDDGLNEILSLVQQRKITLIPTTRLRVGIISKSGKQDGGIVADIIPPQGSKFSSVKNFLEGNNLQLGDNIGDGKRKREKYIILALDQVSNPANVGMIIRSALASNTLDAILFASGSVHPLNPLVIKASSGAALWAARTEKQDERYSDPLKHGTEPGILDIPKLGNKYPEISRSKIIDSNLNMNRRMAFIHMQEPMHSILEIFKEDGAEIALMSAKTLNFKDRGQIDALNQMSLWSYEPPEKCIFVIGGESSGHDPAVVQISNKRIFIPMHSQVESLNCAVAASMVAYAPFLRYQSNIGF